MNLLAGGRRKAVAVALLAGLALLAWNTIDPGQVRWVVMVVLSGFALRILLNSGVREDQHNNEDTRYDN